MNTPTTGQTLTHPRQLEETLQTLGISNPETLTTKQAAAYLSQLKSIPTAPSSLEVYRCKSCGPKYKKIGGRIYYTAPWLDEYAAGIEVKVFDHSRN